MQTGAIVHPPPWERALLALVFFPGMGVSAATLKAWLNRASAAADSDSLREHLKNSVAHEIFLEPRILTPASLFPTAAPACSVLLAIPPAIDSQTWRKTPSHPPNQCPNHPHPRGTVRGALHG